MILTPEETKLAAEQGWQLLEVWIPERERMVLEVHPINAGSINGVVRAYTWLHGKGLKGDKLAIKALKAINNYSAKVDKK